MCGGFNLQPLWVVCKESIFLWCFLWGMSFPTGGGGGGGVRGNLKVKGEKEKKERKREGGREIQSDYAHGLYPGV